MAETDAETFEVCLHSVEEVATHKEGIVRVVVAEMPLNNNNNNVDTVLVRVVAIEETVVGVGSRVLVVVNAHEDIGRHFFLSLSLAREWMQNIMFCSRLSLLTFCKIMTVAPEQTNKQTNFGSITLS